MTLLLWIAVLTAIVAVLVVWVLPWLEGKPAVMAVLDPIAIPLWKKSKSIFWARWLQLIGLGVPIVQGLLQLLVFIGGIDVSPYLVIIPAEYQAYVFLFIYVCGQLGVWLRKETTKPLEVVALPEDKPRELQLAVAKVEAANMLAVVEAKEAKAKGEV